MVNQRSATSAIILAALVIPGAAPWAAAADRYWTAADTGGVFGEPLNWDAGGIPGVADTTIFDEPGVYTVDFLIARVTDRTLVRSGIVTFDLAQGADYTLMNGLVTTPSIVVGDGGGDVATLLLVGGALHGGFADVGRLASGVGSLALDGPAAFLDLDQQLRVGNAGVGFLDVYDGAGASTGIGDVGLAPGSYGSATVEGDGSEWICDGYLTIADRGAGDLSVLGGARVMSSDAIIAQNLGSQGDVLVSGAGSTWTIDGTLDVGMWGIGALTIEDGATVSSTTFSTVGTFPGDSGGDPGGNGEVVVDGAGSSWTIEGGFFSGDLYVGFFAPGALHLSAGGMVHVHGDLVADRFPELGGGPPLAFTLASSADYETPAITIGGAYSGPGAITAPVTLAGGFVPAAGDSFTLVSTGAPFAGIGLDLPALPAGLSWAVTRTATTLALQVFPSNCAVAMSGPDDCNDNGIDDVCDVAFGTSPDCDGNGVPDICDIAGGASDDCNGNGIPDTCDAAVAGADCNANGIPDECEALPVPAVLVGSASGSGSEFGTAVDTDGDRIVVGAWTEGNGAAYVYRFNGTAFVEEARLVGPDLSDGAHFGASVGIDGDSVIVGADRQDPGEDGAIYLYRNDGSGWSWEQTIEAPLFVTARFGHSVAIDGDVAAATGAYQDPVTLEQFGATEIYRYDGAVWQPETQLLLSDGSPFVLTGGDVTLDGDAAAIALRGNADGKAFVYRYDGAAWLEEASFEPPYGVEGITIGAPMSSPVALQGDVLMYTGEIDGDDVVFVHRLVDGVWTDEVILRPQVGGIGFGTALAVDGDLAVIGADGDSAGGLLTGSAIRYRYDGAGWIRTGRLLDPDGTAFEGFGSSAAVSGEQVVVGAPFAGTPPAGRALVFDLTPDCNGNGIPDLCDITSGESLDRNGNGIPDECECAADLDATGDVGFSDIIALLAAWGPCPPDDVCPADLDGSGDVGFGDVIVLLAAWGGC